MKKMNNKGFSLVELIVVIAIMGVLMVVLAPQYLRYVEKSRLQKDNSAIAEIAENIKIAVSDDAVVGEEFDGATITVGNAGYTCDDTALAAELVKTVGETDAVKLTSNTYKDNGNVTLEVTKDSDKFFVVTGSDLILAVGGDATTTTY